MIAESKSPKLGRLCSFRNENYKDADNCFGSVGSILQMDKSADAGHIDVVPSDCMC